MGTLGDLGGDGPPPLSGPGRRPGSPQRFGVRGRISWPRRHADCFGTILGPFLGQFRDHFGPILGPFWDHFGSFWDHLGSILGILRRVLRKLRDGYAAVYLSVCLCICICISACLSVCRSVSVCLSICLSLSLCMSVCLPVCPHLSVSGCPLSLRPSVHCVFLSINLTIYPDICLSIYLSIYKPQWP